MRVHPIRIACISLDWPRPLNSGVGKKIQLPVSAWKAMGHEARLFMHTEQHQPESDLIEADNFYYSASGKIKTELDRIRAAKRMITAFFLNKARLLSK